MRLREHLVVCMTLLPALTLSGCGNTTSSLPVAYADGPHATTPAPTITTPAARTPSPFERFRRLKAGEDGLERFDSLSQLVNRADSVFIGTVTDGRWGQSYSDKENASETDPARYLTDLIYDVHVDSMIAGTAPALNPAGRVTVVMDVVDKTETPLSPPVGHRAIFVLRRIGAPIPGTETVADPTLLATRVYRPVNSLGIVDVGTTGVEFPLGGGGGAWAIPLLDAGNLDAAASLMRKVATGG